MIKFEKLLEKFMKESNKKNKDIRNRLDRKNGTKKKENKNGGFNHA